jgi:hypothetical protein
LEQGKAKGSDQGYGQLIFYIDRFSDHPEIKTDPPYWAGEKFARKAGSLISSDLFEPTVPNLQFWGVMACLEYGRAAGSRAWIYGGLAAR